MDKPSIARWPSPLGTIIVAATSRGLAGLWFEGQKHQPDMRGWTTKRGTDFLNEMREMYRDDVAHLSQLLGRDLSHWVAR